MLKTDDHAEYQPDHIALPRTHRQIIEHRVMRIALDYLGHAPWDVLRDDHKLWQQTWDEIDEDLRRAFLADTMHLNRWSQVKVVPAKHIYEMAGESWHFWKDIE